MASMDHHSHRAKFSSPSFSSTLLDAIYRSIDNSEEHAFKDPMRKKQSQEDMANFQRACLIEKWMEKKRSGSDQYDASSFFNSSSSSSDFSSSSDSVYGVHFQSSSSCYGLNSGGGGKPKPIRTAVSSVQEKDRAGQKPKTGAKSRALKIYTELKKARQPISPGGRLATFLNSIFTPGNAANKAAPVNKSEKKTKSANASTCSSASSFSRSCLSKTPSSAANGLKRSVRFYPVSVIVDEDCQPCGQKSLYDDNLQPKQQQQHQQQKTSKNMDLDLDIETVKKNIRAHVLEKNLRVEDLLRNFQAKKRDDEDEEDDDDDAASYASSDLFELDNLSAIGMDYQRYHEELPVYETTHLGTNRAIANGLIL